MSDFEIHRIGSSDSVAAEREAVMKHLRSHAANIRKMAGRRVSINHVMGEEEANQLGRRIDAIADGIGAGLHIDLPEPHREVSL